MHENRNLFLFLIEINNMHRTRHILPIPRTCIWRQCGRCSVSWHRYILRFTYYIISFWIMVSQCTKKYSNIILYNRNFNEMKQENISNNKHNMLIWNIDYKRHSNHGTQNHYVPVRHPINLTTKHWWKTSF